MKNFCIIFLTLVIITVTALGFSGAVGVPSAAANCDYLRIHIRADSNEEEAQAVKYLVRDRVVEYLTPLVAECTDKAQAMEEMQKRLPQIEQIANGVLSLQGFAYGAEAELTREQFPTRVYGEYLLPAGEYSALVLRLGRGEGDNWWCVVYPPLCFTAGNGNVVYKSKIKEIITRFFAK